MSEARELPQGWAWATVEEVGELVAGVAFPPSRQGRAQGDLPFAKVSDVSGAVVQSGGLIDSAANWVSRTEADELKARIIPEQSVLFAKIGEAIRGNRRAFTQRAMLIDNNTMAFVPDATLTCPRWGYLLLGTIDFYSLANATTVPSLRKSDLEAISIALPPLAEQRRIVAKLDELLARSRRARESLAEVPALVARYRESVLAAAFRGDLTADWREANPAAARGDWARVELDALCEAGRPITYGVVKLGEEVPDGVPCLRTSNVRWLRLECDGMKRIAPDLSAQYGRTVLRGGEVLVNVRGTLGGVAVVEPSMAGWNISREVAVVPSDASRIEPRFLAFTIGAAHSQSVLRGMEKGNAYTGINIEDLRKLPIELPPLAEQREIVRRVEAAFARVDAVEAAVAEQRARLDAYDRSLLARAFAGELVPQDPADEPAAALLARLRAERGEAAPARGRRRRG